MDLYTPFHLFQAHSNDPYRKWLVLSHLHHSRNLLGMQGTLSRQYLGYMYQLHKAPPRRLPQYSNFLLRIGCQEFRRLGCELQRQQPHYHRSSRNQQSTFPCKYSQTSLWSHRSSLDHMVGNEWKESSLPVHYKCQ